MYTHNNAPVFLHLVYNTKLLSQINKRHQTVNIWHHDWCMNRTCSIKATTAVVTSQEHVDRLWLQTQQTHSSDWQLHDHSVVTLPWQMYDSCECNIWLELHGLIISSTNKLHAWKCFTVALFSAQKCYNYTRHDVSTVSCTRTHINLLLPDHNTGTNYLSTYEYVILSSSYMLQFCLLLKMRLFSWWSQHLATAVVFTAHHKCTFLLKELQCSVISVIVLHPTQHSNPSHPYSTTLKSVQWFHSDGVLKHALSHSLDQWLIHQQLLATWNYLRLTLTQRQLNTNTLHASSLPCQAMTTALCQ